MTGSFPIFDIVVLACGVYLIWAAITMKRNRTIPGIMLSKGAEISKTADTEGFLNYMFCPTLMMGIIGSISGLLGVAMIYYPQIGMIQFIVLIITFIMLIVYGHMNIKAQKKFLGL